MDDNNGRNVARRESSDEHPSWKEQAATAAASASAPSSTTSESSTRSEAQSSTSPIAAFTPSVVVASANSGTESSLSTETTQNNYVDRDCSRVSTPPPLDGQQEESDTAESPSDAEHVPTFNHQIGAQRLSDWLDLLRRRPASEDRVAMRFWFDEVFDVSERQLRGSSINHSGDPRNYDETRDIEEQRNVASDGQTSVPDSSESSSTASSSSSSIDDETTRNHQSQPGSLDTAPADDQSSVSQEANVRDHV